MLLEDVLHGFRGSIPRVHRLLHHDGRVRRDEADVHEIGAVLACPSLCHGFITKAVCSLTSPLISWSLKNDFGRTNGARQWFKPLGAAQAISKF